MLSRLSIVNYAIIEELEIDFSKYLNVLTGETGAGKSIIVGALGLILGQRAESAALLKKEKKCIVEGVFQNENINDSVNLFLEENELDLQDELVVRREILPKGKSRAFINDTPVNLIQLHQLSKLLVDLHQQFDTQELGDTEFQREVLDALAHNHIALKNYQSIYTRAQEAKKKLSQLKEKKIDFNKEFDYFQFQFNELNEAGFREDEMEELEQELKLQENAEGIKTALTKSYYDLEEGEAPILRNLKNILNSLLQYSDYHQQLPAITDRLQSAYIDLQDIAEELDRISNNVYADAAAMEKINERLSLGYKLFKKHGVKTTHELLQITAMLNEKLQGVMNIDDEIIAAEKQYEYLNSEALEMAAKISAARKLQIKPLEQQVNKMLIQVGMPNAKLKVEQKKVALTPHGEDEIDFLFDANKSGHFQPLRKVASGGELSRLMLCIKSLVATSMNLPTLIFDEIDTGISGEAARQVGAIMKELSSARQVICITHQPQIAGKADAHYMVYKSVKANVVNTGVRLLNTDERIVAIAKMMSGEKPTAAAIENAREMVMN
jgi:DNA repair protein RecN (Recombination protein N)